jgi:hypothetical protein
MNINKRLAGTVIIIFGIFAIGLVFFFIFSAPYGDGLEKTMEEADAEEGEPMYEAPLDYGEDYLTAFAMGVIGFFAVLLVILVLGRFMGKKDETHND